MHVNGYETTLVDDVEDVLERYSTAVCGSLYRRLRAVISNWKVLNSPGPAAEKISSLQMLTQFSSEDWLRILGVDMDTVETQLQEFPKVQMSELLAEPVGRIRPWTSGLSTIMSMRHTGYLSKLLESPDPVPMMANEAVHQILKELRHRFTQRRFRVVGDMNRYLRCDANVIDGILEMVFYVVVIEDSK